MSDNMRNPRVVPERAYMLPTYVLDNLVGRVLTIIEAMGLKDSQEKSAKDIIRQEIYYAFGPEMAQVLEGSLVYEIRRCEQEIKKSCRDNDSTNAPTILPDVQYSLTWKKL